jgi:hypothetical protein
MKSERAVNVRDFLGADFRSGPTFLDQDASEPRPLNW